MNMRNKVDRKNREEEKEERENGRRDPEDKDRNLVSRTKDRRITLKEEIEQSGETVEGGEKEKERGMTSGKDKEMEEKERNKKREGKMKEGERGTE